MKYYLIKAPENHLIYVEGKRNREAECVELTEDWIQTLCDLTATRLPNELHNRLRKVLD